MPVRTVSCTTASLLAIGQPDWENDHITENELKQQLSLAYLHAVAARAGFACDRPTVDDDSIDLRICARGAVHGKSLVLSPQIELQVKATSTDEIKPAHLPFALPVKNYNDLRQETMAPRLLVVLLLPPNPDHWIEQTEDQMISRRCAYWISLLGEPGRANTKTVTVYLPRVNQFTVSGLSALMAQASRREPL